MSSENQISEERQMLFYLGNILMVVGALMFFSVFLQGLSAFNNVSRPSPVVVVPQFDPKTNPQFDSPPPADFFPSPGPNLNNRRTSRPSEPNPIIAFAGMGVMFLGGVLRSIGVGGVTGSGLVLDPELQRQELKPWSKMAGGMMQDALSEVDLSQRIPSQNQNTIKVRCQSCRTLNDENAKFCDECGKAM